MKRALSAAVAVLAVLAGARPVSAAYVVFADGRSLQVARYRFEQGQTIVELAGGGVMGFSNRAVRYVVPDDDIDRQPRPVAELHREVGDSTAPRSAPGDGWITFADPRFIEPIRRLSSAFELDPALVAAVVKVESDFRPNAVSPRGAQGLMQLMPATARELRVHDPFDPEQNLAGGVRYLRHLIGRYAGDLDRALAAYNAGPGAVDRAGGVPPYPETRRYVRAVRELVPELD